MRSFIDSDILISQLRGERKAARFLRRISKAGAELWIGALQRAEIVCFMRDEESKPTMHLLSKFNTAPVTGEIVDEGAALYRKWNPSHGIDINDAMLAATVMKHGGRIYSLNTKHFPMPQVVVIRGW